MDHSGSPVDGEEGNTLNPRAPLGRYWCFTLNNWTDQELDQIVETCKKNSFEYTIGKEIGTECDTPHLQGFISAAKRIRFPEKFKNKRIHYEKCKGNEQDNLKYVTKDTNYVTNVKKKIVVDPLAGKELYPWQKKLLEELSGDADERKILWYWEPKGSAGKTTFAKHVCMTRNAYYVCGKAADVKCGIVSQIEKGGSAPEIVIFACPREKEDYMQYSALEEVKDGIFFSTKFESNMVIFNIPHVVVFANFEPDKTKLSQDRWKVVKVG